MKTKVTDDQSEPLSDKGPFDISKTNLRFYLLFLSCFFTFGNYFVFDNPSVLQAQVESRLNITPLEFGLLYSIYSFPNIILPFVAGYLQDTIGVRIAILLFTLFISTGQAVFALGVSLRSFSIALIGRGIYGLGAESQYVSQGVVVAEWFRNKELVLSMGLGLCVGRASSVLNNITEPQLYVATGSVVYGFWIGFLICIFSLVCAVLIVLVDRKRDRILGIAEKRRRPESEKFKISDIKLFSLSLWMLYINCFMMYLSIICFNNIASNYYQTRFDYSITQAGMIISITYGIAAVLFPLFGSIVDKIGKLGVILTFASLLVFSVHLMFLITPDGDKPIYPVFYLVLLGIGYSVFATVLWGAIPFLVENKAIGTAYGVAISFQNAGMTFGSLIVGSIQESSNGGHGYYWVSAFFVGTAGLGIISAFLVFYFDKKQGGMLHYKDARIKKSSSNE